LFDQLRQGSDERFQLFLGVKDVFDFLEVLPAQGLVGVLENDLFCAFLDYVVEYLLVRSLSFILKVEGSHHAYQPNNSQ
jgi:hypothetical protein